MTETELTAAADDAAEAPPPLRTKRSAFLIWIGCLAAGVLAIVASLAPLARW